MYNYNVTSEYIDWLCAREAFSAKAYKDGYVNGVQSYSIGYGHQIQLHEQNLRSATWTKTQARAQLIKDLADRIAYVNQNSKKPHTTGSFQACVDYAFNAGVGALQSNILSLHNAGAAKDTVAKQISLTRTTSTTNGISKTNPELVKRRAIEAGWYNGGLLSGTTPLLTILLIPILLYAFYLLNGEQIPFYD